MNDYLIDDDERKWTKLVYDIMVNKFDMPFGKGTMQQASDIFNNAVRIWKGKNKVANMMSMESKQTNKKLIRLTESDLHNIVKESVNKILSEMDWKTYANAERKWADHLMRHPDDPRRKSSIMGADTTGTHDIFADDRLRNFQQARKDAFNRDYGYNSWASPENIANGVNKDRTKGSYEMEDPYQDSGMRGYYDRLRTRTETPEMDDNGKHLPHHRLKDEFQLSSIDGSDSPKTKHETRVDHVKGRYAPDTWVDRDAVEPYYDKIPYMKARNKGNADIERYQNGKSNYVKGKGWQ